MARTTVFVAVALAVAVAGCSQSTEAQSGGAPVPFKLGTFDQNGRVFVGLVLRDTQVVDIARANAAFEASNGSAPRLTAPADMKQLIARYDAEWKDRLGAIARTVSAAGSAPAYAYPLTSLKTLPPVRPSVQLNAGGNYVEHEQGIAANQARGGGARGRPAGQAAAAARAAGQRRRPRLRARQASGSARPGDTRDNPYLFQKSPTILIGNNAPIVVPRGRTNIDFECEFSDRHRQAGQVRPGRQRRRLHLRLHRAS